MRQTHIGGDKLFVDYGGDTVPVIVWASNLPTVVDLANF
jgi:transposase